MSIYPLLDKCDNGATFLGSIFLWTHQAQDWQYFPTSTVILGQLNLSFTNP